MRRMRTRGERATDIRCYMRFSRIAKPKPARTKSAGCVLPDEDPPRRNWIAENITEETRAHLMEWYGAAVPFKRDAGRHRTSGRSLPINLPAESLRRPAWPGHLAYTANPRPSTRGCQPIRTPSSRVKSSAIKIARCSADLNCYEPDPLHLAANGHVAAPALPPCGIMVRASGGQIAG
jgi:hypothetical protein